jgi:hypothetical protein
VDGRFAVTIESAGGSAGGTKTRNPEYPRLLEELLRRTTAMGATIEDAVVTSRQVSNLPESERRIRIEGRPYPFAARPDEDFTALRLGLTRPQGDIGSSRVQGGGNQRKRITLTFRIDPPVDRSEIASRLGAVQEAPSGRRAGIAVGVTRERIEVAIERWKQIGRDAFNAEFGTAGARRYVLLDDEVAIDALALLIGARAIAGLDAAGPWRSDRANVATPLRDMGFGVEDLENPLEAPLGADPGNYADLAGRLGGTDVAVRRMGRREQRFLRGALGIGSGDPRATAICGLCARTLPQSLLVAAHIKPRYLCSDEERVDMPHVGWALCALGCDALFERGYLVVGDGGRVQALRDESDQPAALTEVIQSLQSTVAVGWTPQRQRYFEAHRASHSEGPVSGQQAR